MTLGSQRRRAYRRKLRALGCGPGIPVGVDRAPSESRRLTAQAVHVDNRGLKTRACGFAPGVGNPAGRVALGSCECRNALGRGGRARDTRSENVSPAGVDNVVALVRLHGHQHSAATEGKADRGISSSVATSIGRYSRTKSMGAAVASCVAFSARTPIEHGFAADNVDAINPGAGCVARQPISVQPSARHCNNRRPN